jgi:DNA-binding NtrC family response regulator
MNHLAGLQPLEDRHPESHERAGVQQTSGFLELLDGSPSPEVQSFECVRPPSDDPASGERLARLPPNGIDLRATVEAYENRLLLAALTLTGWNKTRAAKLLGLNRTTLVEMLRRKKLKSPEGIAHSGDAVAAE